MYTILFLFTVTPAWLALPRSERQRINAAQIEPVLKKYASSVQVQFCDAEAFSARCSDFAIFSTSNLQTFYFLFEELRDTALFSQPYLVVNDLIVGLNDGFRTFEQQA